MFYQFSWLLLPALMLVLLLYVLRKRKAEQDAETGDRSSDSAADKSPFFIRPIVQIGNRPSLLAHEAVDIHWHSEARDPSWSLCFRVSGETEWRSASITSGATIKLQNIQENTRFSATLDELVPGKSFEYEIFFKEKHVFASSAMARKGRGQNQRMVIVGDLTEGSNGARKVAYQISRSKPDMLVLAGDLAYRKGLFSEYLERFFPVYNAESASQNVGAPLLASCITLTEPGNHDVGMPSDSDIPDFDRNPDLMAHYIFWSLPLNGPVNRTSKKHVAPLAGNANRISDFLRAAGERYPRIGNCSLDAGDCHLLILDSNVYVDWTDEQLVAWVEADLNGANKLGVRWKLVSFHHAAFTAHWKHSDEQRMRLLAPVFERHGVHVVFSGHNHTYERSYPLRFEIKAQADGKLVAANGHVDGTFALDRAFNGKEITRANGVLYIVTGGGGARQKLMSENPDAKASLALPEFTVTMVDNIHSFTCLDVEYERLVFRQISEDGVELDTFVLTQ